MYYEYPYKIFSSVHIWRFDLGTSPRLWKRQKETLFPGTLCLFMSGVRAVQFYSYLPRSESGFHFKSIFYLLPTFRWQCLKLRLAGAQLLSLLFLISKVPSISHTGLLLWWFNAAVRPSAILARKVDVKIREKSCPNCYKHVMTRRFPDLSP